MSDLQRDVDMIEALVRDAGHPYFDEAWQRIRAAIDAARGAK